MARDPYLSIVLVGRNDNYGGDFNKRLQNMADWFAMHADKAKLRSEFLLVNYNPLADQATLREAINWPKSEYVKFRIITVPTSFHKDIEDPKLRKPVPLYEYIAKNIGIRRAKGEYILITNPDIIYDPRIIRFLGSRKLDPKSFYRTDRLDFKDTGLRPAADPAGFLKAARKNSFKLYLKGHQYPVSTGTPVSLQLVLKRLRNKWRIAYDLFVVKIDWLMNKLVLPVDYDNAEYHFHCNVSGDFMLMHRDRWAELHAYPQDTYLALHVDALMVIIAGASGMKEHVFKWPIYHQDHERRYDSSKIKEDRSLYDAYRFFEDHGRAMIEEGKAKLFNGPDWGFPAHDFEDMVLNA